MSTMDWYYKKLMRERKRMGYKYTLPAAEVSCTQPTDAQQAKENIKPSCFTCVWHRSGSEACGEGVDFSWWQRV
jgi:hypothetical protein